jgi:KDO2-lipid IV(A) lauroyltransferase
MPEKNRSLRRFIRPRYWNAWLGYAVLRLISFFPLPVIATLGYVLGELAYFFFSSRRHIARRNIDACFPELSKYERRTMLRRNFHVIGQGMLSTATVWWASRSRLRRLVRTRNEHFLRNAVEQDRKVILLVPHFVAVEIGGVFLSIDYPILDIYQRLRSELFDTVAYRQLTRFGGKMVEMREGLRTPIREVKNGTVLYYLPDQDSGLDNGAFVPFFGHPAATMTTLGRLVQITSAVVIPCYTNQLSWGRGYEVIFQPPLDNFPTGEGPEVDARRMNEAIETAVREIPEQYFWVHRRFKTRPQGQPPFYDK